MFRWSKIKFDKNVYGMNGVESNQIGIKYEYGILKNLWRKNKTNV